MKSKLFGIIILLFIIFLTGCSNSDDSNINQDGKTLALGKYKTKEDRFAYVELMEDNKFVFNYSSSSSYKPSGIYEIKDNQLKLTSSESHDNYIFIIDNQTIQFDQGLSSPLQSNKLSTNLDGAIFELPD